MQQNLWRDDAYTILWHTDLGKIGKTRLKRYLKWLDTAEQNWTRPDLEAYGDYLRDDLNLHKETIYQTITEIRQHYLAVLSDPAHYKHVPLERRAQFVNGILNHLDFNPITVRYEVLVGDVGIFDNENMRVLFPQNSNPKRHTHLTMFIQWLNETNRHWSDPDLLAYKEYLLTIDGGVSLVKNAMGVVRRRYHDIVDDGKGAILELLAADEREAFLNEFRKRLGYLDEYPSKLNPSREMIEEDPHNKNWLNTLQQDELLNMPDASTLVGLRDRALLGLALATGIYRSEMARVCVEHLRHDYQGQLALRVEESKQFPERLIPYEEYVWVLDWLDQWLGGAGITEGAVFRGTYGNRDTLRPSAIAPETASDILARYPVTINGHTVPLLFGDLRATAGRRWYEAGKPLAEIERRLGIQYRPSMLNLIGLKVRDAFGG